MTRQALVATGCTPSAPWPGTSVQCANPSSAEVARRDAEPPFEQHAVEEAARRRSGVGGGGAPHDEVADEWRAPAAHRSGRARAARCPAAVRDRLERPVPATISRLRALADLDLERPRPDRRRRVVAQAVHQHDDAGAARRACRFQAATASRSVEEACRCRRRAAGATRRPARRRASKNRRRAGCSRLDRNRRLASRTEALRS